MVWVDSLLFAAGVYLAMGVATAILFLIFFVHRLDAAAKGASPAFRPMIFAGCVLLWPYIVLRILSARQINKPAEEDA